MDLLTKINKEGIQIVNDTFIEKNRKSFDVIFEKIRRNKIEDIDKNKVLSNELLEELIQNIKKSNCYYGYFSLESLRNGEKNTAELSKLLKEDVQYFSFNSVSKSLASGLFSIIYNFIEIKLHPKIVKKILEDNFDLSPEISETIGEFYMENYKELQLNYIIDKLQKI